MRLAKSPNYILPIFLYFLFHHITSSLIQDWLEEFLFSLKKIRFRKTFFSSRESVSRDKEREKCFKGTSNNSQIHKNSRYESRFSRKGFMNRRCSIQPETRLKEKKKKSQVFPQENTTAKVFDVNARATSHPHKVLKEQSCIGVSSFSFRASIQSPSHRVSVVAAFAIRLPIPYFNGINLI